MSLKRTQSVVFNKEKGSEKAPNQQVQRQVAVQSAQAMSVDNHTRLRVPVMLQSALREQARNSGSNRFVRHEDDMKGSSRLGGMMRNSLAATFQKMKEIAICQICEGQIRLGKKKNKNIYLANCDHKNNYCESCLHHYAIYKVNNFEEVICPDESCNAVLDTTSPFFKNLPADIQKNYKKIHQFQSVANDPNSKLCPQQKCEGVIRGSAEGAMTCDACKKQFCGKCLLANHEGECDKQEVLFFEQNLHYRQCKKCGFVIEKNQGCNHMTCRCKYQFCYVCGAKWSSAHYGEHDQNGNLVQAAQGGQANVNNGDEDCCDDCCQGNCCCCNCDCDDDNCCGCLDDCCCGFIIKGILKVLLFILFLFAMLLILLTRDVLVWFAMFLASIIAGIFGFTFEFICEQQGILCFLAVLFLPISMIIGIGIGFKEVFCEVVGELCSQYCQMFRDGVNSICQM